MSRLTRMRATSAGNGDGPRELPPAGTYKGRLIGIFDLGTQDGGQFPSRHQVLFLWELFKGSRSLTDSNGNVHTVSRFLTLSLNENATLRSVVEAILGGKPLANGDDFDLTTLLGSGCRLQLVDYTKQNGNPGVKVKSVIGLDDDETVPQSATEPVLFEITGTQCAIPSEVPGWVAEIIRRSSEWQGTTMPSKPVPTSKSFPVPDDSDTPPF